MTTELLFDTLKYAKLLTHAGVEQADKQAEALADALKQNIYPKPEIDKMIEAAIKNSNQQFQEALKKSNQQFQEALKRFDERTEQMRREINQETKEIRAETNEIRKEFYENRKEFLKLQTNIQADIHRILTRGNLINLSIMGSILGFFTFIEHFLR